MSDQQQEILDRLERVEKMLEPISESMKAINEFRTDAASLMKGTMQLLIEELREVETGFCLDDFFYIIKRTLRSIKSIGTALEQLDMIIDASQTMEPLLRSSVPQFINYLDELDQTGVLRIIQAGLGVRSKIAKAYSADDIEAIGDGLVSMLGLAQSMAQPQSREFIEKMAALPAKMELDKAKSVGPIGMISQMGKPEVRKGLGVMVQMLKAIGQMDQPIKSEDVPANY